VRVARVYLEEFINERAIVDDGLAHFLRAGFAPVAAQRQRASGAVVLHDDRVINGQVGRTPIEVFKGVATRGHHLGDELIGFPHGGGGVVHKARLDATPFAGKRIGLIVSELVQVEAADALSALSKDGVSACRTHSLNGSFVLGTKAFAQIDAA
jgi:hypothetical protein